MPIRTVPGTDLTYYLVSFDEQGRERTDDGGGRLGDQVRQRVADTADPVTDVFFASHGWKGDVPAAISQYDRWLGAMVTLDADRAAAQARPQGFRPVVVGLHWPSLPWGDETLPAGGVLSGEDGTDPDAHLSDDEVVDAYAKRIADTAPAREALQTIMVAARNGDADVDGPALKSAYATLFAESGLGGSGATAAPGSDQDGFDPKAIIDESAALTGVAPSGSPGVLGGGFLDKLRDALLMPVRQLSFWTMKDRARVIGETGAHDLLRSLQAAAPAARFHLMGHSFGCIVVTGAVVGPPGGSGPVRPVESLFLVQGALSLWSACPDVPYQPGSPGYFSRLVGNGMVRGTIGTTRSAKDTAVGTLYPLGARIKQQLLLDDPGFPEYGGVGTFGLQGLGAVARDLPIANATHPYGFAPGVVANVECTRIIANGGGPSGAHSDIAHPEVAHLQWELALAAP